MGEFTYEEQGTYTWLVYGIEDNEEIDSLSLGMLTKNKVPGILPVIYTPINNTGYIKYNVSSRVSVKDYLTGMVNRERMLGVFSGIISAMTAAESYMLDANSLILDLSYIFVDVSTKETNMICVPVLVKEQKHMDLAGFFRNILFTVQFDPSENFDYVTLIVNYLNGTQMFSLAEFGKLVANLRLPGGGTGVAGSTGGIGVGGGAVSSGMPASGSVSDECGRAVAEALPSRVAPLRSPETLPPKAAGDMQPSAQRQDSESAGEFGGIIIPGSPGKAGLPGKSSTNKSKKPGLFDGLKSKHKSAGERKAGKDEKNTNNKKHGRKEMSQSNISIPLHADTRSAIVSSLPGDIPMTDDGMGSEIQYGATADDFEMPGMATLRLLYITEGRTIAVTSFPYEIGREGSGLKIDVSKTKISRRHAVITQAGSQFLITDFSKHGTFLNGVRIPQGEPKILENGMRVLLKTEEFEVKIDRA